MEERKLNEKESLELITRMIRNTKHNLEIGDGNIFLFWGYLTVTSTAIVYLLLQLTENLMSYLAFLLIIVVGIPLSYYFKRKRLPKVKTYTDKVLEQIWGCHGIYRNTDHHYLRDILRRSTDSTTYTYYSVVSLLHHRITD